MTQGQAAGSLQPHTHPVPSPTTALSIKKCDLKITTNNSNHHTEEISTERLMLRRGQPFTITVHFSSPVDSYLQQMKRASLTVQTGNIITALSVLVLCTPEEQNWWQKPSPELHRGAHA